MAAVMTNTQKYKGNDKVLLGMVFGLLSFWLIAMTLLSIQPVVGQSLGIDNSTLSLAITLTSLVSGATIVMWGNLADKIGRVRIMRYGFYFAILGSSLIAITPVNSALTAPVMIAGRVLQGLSGACIMPSTLAILRTYWEDKDRQRAVSLWSMGTWGGTSFATLVGTNMSDFLGWRSIFILGVILAIIGLLLTREIPETKAETSGAKKFDIVGLLLFVVSVVSIMLVVTFGTRWGWTSPLTLGLAAVAIVGFFIFVKVEAGMAAPFVDFKLFDNKTFTGATASNFILNSTAGVLVVIPALMLNATDIDPKIIGYLSLGYGVIIISFIRLGEKLLQKHGPRNPMLWGCMILLAAVLIMLPTNIMREQYMILMGVGYALFGLGLAFYATPSTDAALSTLPPEKSAGGSGIYKMASSLGAAFGIGISSAIYYSLTHGGKALNFINSIFIGDQSNVVFRQSAMIALLFNAVMICIAILVVFTTVPKGKKVQQ